MIVYMSHNQVQPESLFNAQEFADFITVSPSGYHAAEQVAKALRQAGFRQQDETAAWDATAGGHFLIRDGAVLAYYIPQSAGPHTPFRIIGAHTDSPGLKLKPNPDARSKDGFNHLGVEVYGGALFNSWLDRDLELAGRIVDESGQVRLVRTGPLLRVPQLAPHLDRSVNKDGVKLNPQKHLHPIWGIRNQQSILDFIAQKAGLDSGAQISGYDLITVDSQAPAFLGAEGELMAAGRMDNLVSTFAGMKALLQVAANGGATDGSISVLACFDHEEIGSMTRAGAQGPVLADVLSRTIVALGGTEDDRGRAFAASSCMSSDVGHSVNPNYSEKHDPDNRPVLGSGPILKINANQRYTTDAPGCAIWKQALHKAGVMGQDFVSKNDVTCGSTIGPMTAARLGIMTFDVGIAILSMHSAREMCHIADLLSLRKVMTAYLQG